MNYKKFIIRLNLIALNPFWYLAINILIIIIIRLIFIKTVSCEEYDYCDVFEYPVTEIDLIVELDRDNPNIILNVYKLSVYEEMHGIKYDGNATAETSNATAETSNATAETSNATAETSNATAEISNATAEISNATAETSYAITLYKEYIHYVKDSLNDEALMRNIIAFMENKFPETFLAKTQDKLANNHSFIHLFCGHTREMVYQHPELGLNISPAYLDSFKAAILTYNAGVLHDCVDRSDVMITTYHQTLAFMQDIRDIRDIRDNGNIEENRDMLDPFLQEILNSFNYKKFYQSFSDGIAESDNSRQMTQFVIKFFNENLPKEYLSKSEVALTDPNDPMVTFLDIIAKIAPQERIQDILVLQNFQAALSIYNIQYVFNQLEDIEFFEKIYMAQLSKIHDKIS
jgi:hypothetical protein